MATVWCLIRKPGKSFWLGYSHLTAQSIYPTNLLVHWQFGEYQTWCLATNLLDCEMTLHYHRLRMCSEELHGDLKTHGFDLVSPMLHDFLRLSRLTLAVAFFYVWFISSVGSRTIHAGLCHLVDRNDRRNLSTFQLGLRFTQRILTNALSVSIPLCI